MLGSSRETRQAKRHHQSNEAEPQNNNINTQLSGGSVTTQRTPAAWLIPNVVKMFIEFGRIAIFESVLYSKKLCI